MLCPTCKVALQALSAIEGAFGCEACRGCWLDPRLQASIGAPVAPGADAVAVRAHDRSEGPRACPSCGADLVRVFVSAPTPVEVDRCASHGTWLEAHDLPAIRPSNLAFALARALVAGARTDPAERDLALAALDGLRGRGAGMLDFVRPAGNPALVSLGHAAVFHGGVWIVSAHGQEVLVPAPSVGTWPLILLATGLFTMVACAFGLIGQPLWLALGVEAFLGLLFVAITAGSYFVALRASRHRLVFDAVRRQMLELRGDRVLLTIPASLVRSVRIQLYADPGYADRYDVLCPLGFAELWIHQGDDLESTTSIARRVAAALCVPFDPQLQRKC